MSQNVKVIILRTAGTNCNEETAFAFSRLGAHVEQVHVKALISGVPKLSGYHILALPGGFSYGDDIASGRILANELRLKLAEDIKQFIGDGKLIIGICNGFQVLAKAGILPGLGWSSSSSNRTLAGARRTLTDVRMIGQETTLFYNDSAKFEARWVRLKVNNRCVWTRDMPSQIYLPVAHGEGKFIPREKKVLDALVSHDQIVLRYCAPGGGKPAYPDNPNGSVDDIAGISDTTGRVFGLMPHPERHFLFEQHPYWTRLKYQSVIPAKAGIQNPIFGDGAKIFENGINYVKENLL
jgi:phosphoribosylformylglycinamidine synthase subunit PurQ / glutaminase